MIRKNHNSTRSSLPTYLFNPLTSKVFLSNKIMLSNQNLNILNLIYPYYLFILKKLNKQREPYTLVFTTI